MAELDGFEITDPHKSVQRDIAALRANSQLPDGVIVTGLVYDVKTGRVETDCTGRHRFAKPVKGHERDPLTRGTSNENSRQSENPPLRAQLKRLTKFAHWKFGQRSPFI